MTAIALLPLLLATPTIDGAKLELREGNLRLEVATSEPVAREDVRTKLDGKGLSVYIDGAEVLGRKSFGTAELGGNILPRSAYAKIEIPLAAAMGCGGKAAITVTDTGLRATLPCKAPEAAATPEAAQPVAAAPVKALEEAKPPEPAAKAPEAAPKAPEPAPKAPEPAKAAEAAAKAPEPTRAAEPVAKAEPVKAAEPVASTPAPAKAASSGPAIVGGVAASKGNRFSSLPTMIMVGLLLVGGYFLWRRKKHQRSTMIRILETASLGPKRALVVAEVNGEKMILGTSEAGITMLSPMSMAMSAGGFPTETTGVAHRPAPSLAAALATAAMAAPAKAEPTKAADDLSDADMLPQPEGEGGLLAKLFKRRREVETTDDEGPSTMADDFRDLLEDSLEDEELRRRLQSGLGGRTQ